MELTTIGSPALWIGFISFVMVMLALDLAVFHKKAHVVKVKEALGWSAVSASGSSRTPAARARTATDHRAATTRDVAPSMSFFRSSLPIGLLVATTACSSATTPSPTSPSGSPSELARPVERSEVEGAQRAWCDALIAIGKEGASGGDAKAKASEVLSSAYGYDDGPVLFKPTLTHGAQTFRLERAGALAYFVGGDPAYPDDTGFALKQWVRCEPKVVGVLADGEMALAMGNVALTDVNGNQVRVDKTFGYRRSPDGGLRIVLHHSSLPYAPGK